MPTDDEASWAEIEQHALERVKQSFGGPADGHRYRKRIDEITLEGVFPDTRIVLTGEHSYGGTWRIRFPVWDRNHALSPHEGTPPDYRRLIGFLEIDLLEKQ